MPFSPIPGIQTARGLFSISPQTQVHPEPWSVARISVWVPVFLHQGSAEQPDGKVGRARKGMAGVGGAGWGQLELGSQSLDSGPLQTRAKSLLACKPPPPPPTPSLYCVL